MVAGLGTSSISTSDLVQSIGKNLQAQAQKKVQTVADSYTAQISAVNTESATLLKADTSITKAISKITSAANKLDQIDTMLLNMTSAIDTAATDQKYGTESFDYNLAAVSSVAQGDTSSTNLLGSLQRGGNYTPNSVQYIADQSGRVVTVNGTYLGTDYQINQSDGTFWMRSGSQTLQQYTAYPFGAKGSGVSIALGDIKANSSAPAGTVSYTGNLSVDVSGQQTIQGTLTQPGLGVLNAFMYNNFATADDRAKAMADIVNAQGQVALARNSLNAALVTAQNDLNQEKATSSAATTQVTDLQNQAKAAEQQVNTQAQAQMKFIQEQFSAPDSSALSIMQGGDSTSLYSALLPTGSSASSDPSMSILNGGSADALFSALIPPASASQSNSASAPGSVLNVKA
jgi:hypothetical protein